MSVKIGRYPAHLQVAEHLQNVSRWVTRHEKGRIAAALRCLFSGAGDRN